MKRERYTYHQGKAVDITEDSRPTAWERFEDYPFRPVKNVSHEFIIFLLNQILPPLLLSSSLSADCRRTLKDVVIILEGYCKRNKVSPYLGASEALHKEVIGDES